MSKSGDTGKIEAKTESKAEFVNEYATGKTSGTVGGVKYLDGKGAEGFKFNLVNAQNNSVVDTETSGAVSYTHLDVYKRQKLLGDDVCRISQERFSIWKDIYDKEYGQI